MIKVIITGATGMVGEGVLLECLSHPEVAEVLVVGRRSVGRQHAKLKELIVPDFTKLEGFANQLTGYDGCFFCAGVSSIGMNEQDYTKVTYDTTLSFAQGLFPLNPGMVFCFVSGAQTDTSEKGKVMWARVKGKTENALTRVGFRNIYNFRPGFMKPVAGQRNIKTLFKAIIALYPLVKLLFPKQLLTLNEVGQAMINSVIVGYPKQVLEIGDIRALANAK